MVNDFDLTNPDFFVSGDPHSLWKELRATDPVHWTERRDRSGSFIEARCQGKAIWRRLLYGEKCISPLA